MKPPKFAVHPRAAKRLLTGHPWVFGNELTVPAKELPVGGTVDITATDGRFLGRGYANPASLIAVRLCSRSKAQHIDLPGFWASRLRTALEVRAALFPGSTAYRWVHGEADGIPGLIVDRYGDYVVAQVLTVGIQHRLDAVKEALLDVLPGLRGGLFRNDVKARDLEGLSKGVTPWFGEVPATVDIDEDGVAFRVDPHDGLRTGHFFDQRQNRGFAARLCTGGSMLDVYANTGGWGLHALNAGAAQVTFIEKSESACAAIEANAALNGVQDQVSIFCDEGRKTLMAMLVEGQRFDGVVLDPPPFAKTKKAAGSALKGYKEINSLAMQLVRPGGWLFTSCCSRFVFEDRFVEAVQAAAVESGKRLVGVRRSGAASDHPVLPSMPDSRYLKSFAFHVQQDT
ncbi:MAG: class I SAM-dependent rRNA methyltransferase [Myxococcota bacterium]